MGRARVVGACLVLVVAVGLGLAAQSTRVDPVTLLNDLRHLSADDMERYGARVERFIVSRATHD